MAANAAPAQTVFDHPADSAQLARDLAPTLATVRNARTLRGRYVQQKRLHEVPRPLRAEGSFLFVRGLGIAWRTEVPFESELVITQSDIIQREGATTTLHVSAAQQPGIRVVAGIFNAVFALDFDALGAMFELYSRRNGDRWELGLRPRAGQAGALRSVTVSGRKQVERVHFDEANGDMTDLDLKGQASAEAPSAEDQQRFKP